MARAPTNNGDNTPVPGREEGLVEVETKAKSTRGPALMTRVSNLYSAIAILLAVAAGGGGLYVYMTGNASTSDLRAADHRIDNHEARIQMVENAILDEKHDRRLMQLQLFELARATGARVVPGLPASLDDDEVLP